jgi:hypothetical protein
MLACFSGTGAQTQEIDGTLHALEENAHLPLSVLRTAMVTSERMPSGSVRAVAARIYTVAGRTCNDGVRW